MSINASMITKTVDQSRKVLDAMDRKEARVLVRTGAFGRRTMRRTIPRRKSKSAPGRPPHAHRPGGSGLKDVRYQVSRYNGSVIIGHQRYPRRNVISNKPAPQLLNEGGPARIVNDHPQRGRQQYPAHYRARPFRDRSFSPTLAFFKERLANERFR